MSDSNIQLIAWGVKHGQLPAADHHVDCRGLVNPYHIAALKDLNGYDPKVYEYVARGPAFKQAVTQILTYVSARLMTPDRPDLKIVTYCMGGRHRSVVVALAARDALIQAGIPADSIEVQTPCVEALYGKVANPV